MRTRMLAVAAAGVLAVVVGTALPASAAGDGGCGGGDGCLYYNSNRGGSLTDYRASDPNLAGDRFIGPGAGHGQYVKNNAASVWNRYGYAPFYIYYNENYTGPFDRIPANSWRNLVHTLNNNASLTWQYS